MNTRWRYLLLIGCLLGLGSTRVSLAQNTTSLPEQSVEARGVTSVRISKLVGDFVIQATDTQKVTVVEKRRLSGGGQSSQNQIAVQRNGNLIDITSPNGTVGRGSSFVVTIPFSVALSVDLYNGNIDVMDVKKDVEVNTGSGNISVARLGAQVDLRTGSGNIVLNDVSGTSTVNSGAGNVSATNIRSALMITTGGGNVDIDQVLGALRVITAGGNLGIRKVTGSSQLFTSGGNIAAVEMKGEIDASTSGGDIIFSDISGSIQASTNGGNIKATRLSSYIRAHTIAGNIQLSDVSGGFDVISEVGDVTIDVSNSRFLSNQNASIESNFGNVRLRIPSSMNGLISAQVSGNGSIEFKNPGSNVKVLSNRSTEGRDQVKRAEYQVGNGGGRISLGARTGKIEITIK